MSSASAPWKSEDWLRQKYCAENMTIQEIADHADTSFDTIRYYKDKFDIEGRPNGVSQQILDATKSDLETLYWDEQKSLGDIGEHYDCSGVRVLKKMKTLGVERREGDDKPDHPWQDKETLEAMVDQHGNNATKLADEMGASRSTVSKWLREFGIKTIPHPTEQPPSYRTHISGHEVVRTKIDQQQHTAFVHRLVAVADGKLTPEEFINSEKNVHHKNGVPWDNRPENLEVMTKSEHHKHHYQEIPKNDSGQFTTRG